ACASSLGALKMAISELVENRADMMITGGVDTDNSIFAYLCFSKTPAVSPGEKVKPFDAESDGMMLGEGVGMVVLKRLDDAVRDGDRIYAVIKGIGSSSDGKYKSIYAPHSQGQVKALRRAYENAGVSPETVGLIEAHGTGTMVGDPTEFTSITEVFSDNNPKKQYIALGTVKSQIGHTKAAAGAASLIKTALALHHKVLPPTINVTQPHPKLNIENSPFYLNTETRPWISNQPRRAGVSAFGFGGTNYHVVLEEYTNEHEHSYRLHNSAKSILLFAPTTAELLSRCENIQRQLESENKEQHYQQLITESEQLEIPINYPRVGFVAASLTQATEFLPVIIDLLKNKPQSESWEHPKGIYYRQKGIETTGKIVALFSGQGSQYLEMGRELVINFPNLRQTYNQIDNLFCKDGLNSLSEVVFPPPVFEPEHKQKQLETLQKTEYAQPAIGAFSTGLYKILQQAGLKANFVAGHSFGELTALWAGGVLSEEDYFFLVKARGQAMATPTEIDAGGMLAVKGNVSQVTELIKDFPQVAIANCNSPNQVVLAGKKAEITKVQNVLQEKGFSTFLLGVSAAFHTPLVAHAQKPFAQAIEKVTFNQAQIPVYTNVTGELYPNQPAAMQKILKQHLLNQVLFQQEIENIYAAGGYCFIEFGPKNVLTNLVKEILGEKPHIAIALNGNYRKNSDLVLREAVIQLRVAGIPLQNLDPYQIETKIPEVNKKDQKKILNVRLNSTNITDKAQKAFAKALENGHVIKAETAKVNEHHPQPVADIKITVPKNQELLVEKSSNGKTVNKDSNGQLEKIEQPEKVEIQLSNYDRVIDRLEQSLAEFTRQQSEITHAHEQSLQNQTEYTKTFYELMQQQYSLLANDGRNEHQAQTQQLAISSCERSIMRLHDHQAETIRIHEKYLNYQQDYANNYFQLLQQHYDFWQITDDINQNQSPSQPLPHHLLKAQKNGKSLINENDLNISPHLVGEGLGERFISPPQPEEKLEEKSNTINVVPTTPINIDTSTLSQTLLNIVSDKTGYPVEMLDLSMDIEADLGIDSIKRVEILGGLLELYPDLPRPNPEELGQLRTLGEIAEYMQHQAEGLTQLFTQEKQDIKEQEFHHKILRSPAKLKPLPQPDILDFTIPENQIVLITDDGSPTTEKLARILTGRGCKIVVLSFPSTQSDLPVGINQVRLNDWQEESLQQQLTDISNKFGLVGSFIHLHPVFSDSSETEKTILCHVFLIAKHLKESLNQAATKGRSSFLSIARLDGEFGLGKTNNFSPISAGLFGLTKSLNQEWETVFCRSLDLSPDLDAETSVKYILAELQDPNLLVTEVGYTNKGRCTLVAEPTPLTIT
ncbi:MAG: acyltransferase domain-containing protein, partial [Sphaerospermopsis kisseleviana]